MFSQSRSHALRPLLVPIGLLLSLIGLMLLAQQPWNSAVQTTPGMPGVQPASGHYANRVRVTLRASNPRSQIVYTLDGSDPTANVGARYTKPLVLDTKGIITIRAVEVLGGTSGPVRTVTYAIDVPGQLPILSLSLPPAALWDPDEGIFTNPTWRGTEWERETVVSYLLPDGDQGFATNAGLRVDKAGTKPDLRLYFRSEYGTARLAYPLFPQHMEQSLETQSFKRLLLLGGHPGQDTFTNTQGWLWTDQLARIYATAMGLRTAQGQAVHLFINGESWGMYYLAERVDRFFLTDNYGYKQVDAVREGKTVEGDDADWDALVDWSAAHDLSLPEQYAYMQSQMDISQFIDAVILYAYLDLPPDSLIAIRPELGLWEWVYAGGGEMVSPFVQSSTKSDLEILYSELMANEAFQTAFATRAADLLNSELTAASMETQIAVLASAWEQDFSYERGRWFYGEPWEEEVSALQQWGQARADVLANFVQEQTGFSETVQYTFDVHPTDAGYLYANGMALNSEQELRYFSGIPVTITAQPVRWPLPGYRFTGWEICDGVDCRQLNDGPELSLIPHAGQQITAYFDACLPGECVAANSVSISEFWINDNGTKYPSLENRPIIGDWVELRVMQDAIDLRGWRLTDNDTLTGTAEGSLIFPDHPALASLDKGTVILLVTTLNADNTDTFLEDDVDARDKRLLFYVGNGNLDTTTDPGFGIGKRDDNVVLLAPGPTEEFADDIGIDFIAEGDRVTPFSFGVLAHGVRFPEPFRFLGDDDGASWYRMTKDPDNVTSWRVDPPACQSGDAICWGERNQVTPGR